MACLAVAVLALGYTIYGRFIAGQYRLDAGAVTPAVAVNDGVDFVPDPAVLPARPALQRHRRGRADRRADPGVPAVRLAAVPPVDRVRRRLHRRRPRLLQPDRVVRHDGRSIAEIVKENLGPRAWFAIMLFIWLALIYVIVAFTRRHRGHVRCRRRGFRRGAALQSGRRGGARQRPLPAAGGGDGRRRAGAPAAAVAGDGRLRAGGSARGLARDPALHAAGPRADQLGADHPRVLFRRLAGAGVGAARSRVATWVASCCTWRCSSASSASSSAASRWSSRHSRARHVAGPTGSLFPFLFVTIACGACSGFHGLVCSGTTSKQIRRETDCRPIGYGGHAPRGVRGHHRAGDDHDDRRRGRQGKPPGVLYGAGIGGFSRC